MTAVSWFSKLLKSRKRAEPESESKTNGRAMLPDFAAGREDTAKFDLAVERVRAPSEQRAKLEETAKDVCEEAKTTSNTIRSMPAFPIPEAAQTDVGE